MTTIEAQAILMAAAVFICSGVAYSMAGYKAKVYKFLNSDPDVKFDFKRISKKIALGVFLGLAVFITEDLINGEEAIAITEPGVFVKQVIFNVGAIYAFDKLMFAGKGGTKTSAAPVAGTGPGPDDLDAETYADIADDAIEPPEIDSAPPDIVQEVTKA